MSSSVLTHHVLNGKVRPLAMKALTVAETLAVTVVSSSSFPFFTSFTEKSLVTNSVLLSPLEEIHTVAREIAYAAGIADSADESLVTLLDFVQDEAFTEDVFDLRVLQIDKMLDGLITAYEEGRLNMDEATFRLALQEELATALAPLITNQQAIIANQQTILSKLTSAETTHNSQTVLLNGINTSTINADGKLNTIESVVTNNYGILYNNFGGSGNVGMG